MIYCKRMWWINMVMNIHFALCMVAINLTDTPVFDAWKPICYFRCVFCRALMGRGTLSTIIDSWCFTLQLRLA